MDFLFPQKNAPLQLSRQLRQLIEVIGQTKTKQEEQKIIKGEIESVKKQFHNQMDPSTYPDIIVKLIYFQTLGYNTSFARILPINLCQSQSLYLKKISYLLAAMLVKPGQKIALLMHNTIIKDLESENVFITMTVLTMLRYFINDYICRQILPLIRKMLKHKIGMIRRKSLLVLYNIYQLFPHLVDDLSESTMICFMDADTPVKFAAINIIKNLIKTDYANYKAHTHKFVQTFQQIMDHKYQPQYDYHKIPAPWIQIDLLQILARLGKNDQQTSTIMHDCLEKCLRRSQNLFMHFNRGILLQCIITISTIYPHEYLLSESQASLFHFFSDGNTNNLKSFGLTAMRYLAKIRPNVMNRWQLFLVQCLESNDISLCQKTIGLLIEIADQNNTEVILNRIIALTQKSTDSAEKKKFIKNSIYLIERFSYNKEIFMRRMNQIFYKFPQFVSDVSINNFLKTLQQMVELQPNFVNMLVNTYIEIVQNFRNKPLAKVSVWILGEMTHHIYIRDKNSEAVDRSVQAMLACADDFLNDTILTFTIVSSLLKLSSVEMTSKHDQIKEFLLKVESQIPNSIYKCGEEAIKIAKYGKALYASDELEFDPKMNFLGAYLQKNYAPPAKKYIVTKQKSERAQNNYLDLCTPEVIKRDSLTGNIFEFKPGQRWGNTNSEQKPELTQIQQTKPPQTEQRTHKKSVVLRGPHQQKTKPSIDQKKLKLAQSIFGAKK